MSFTKNELKTFLNDKKVCYSESFHWYITVPRNILEDEWEKINKIKHLEYDGHDTGFNSFGTFEENCYFITESSLNEKCKSTVKKLSKIVGKVNYSITRNIKSSFYDEKNYCGIFTDKNFKITEL
jgi:hypothetical protein